MRCSSINDLKKWPKSWKTAKNPAFFRAFGRFLDRKKEENGNHYICFDTDVYETTLENINITANIHENIHEKCRVIRKEGFMPCI